VALLPAPLVAVAVVATGNHYVLDVVVGSAVAVSALLLITWHPVDRAVPLRLHPHPVLLRHHRHAS
jgi:hypothetical protein